MMKKFGMLVICLMLILSMALNAYAAETPVHLDDQADLLTPSEELQLAGELDRISGVYGVDVVIVTIPELYGSSAMAFADDYYDTRGYGPDGILLLISIGDREWAISTAGSCISTFTDAGLAYIEDRFLPDLSDGQYGESFLIFARQSEEFLAQAESGRPFDVRNLPKSSFGFGKHLLIALGIGFLVALIVTGIMKGKLKTVGFRSAGYYVRDGSFKLTESRDLFLYSHVSRQKREKSGPGGSSTHVSAGGRSHGGRSGRF